MTRSKAWPSGKRKAPAPEMRCLICSSPSRALLDADSRRGDGITALSRRYEFPQQIVRRHLAHGEVQNQLAAPSASIALQGEVLPTRSDREREWSTATIVEKLGALEGDLRRLATSAEERGFTADATNAIREVVRLVLLIEEHRPDETRGPEFPELSQADVALLRACSTEELWTYAQTGVVPSRFRDPSPPQRQPPATIDPYAGLTRDNDEGLRAAAAGEHTAPLAEPQPSSGAIREGEHHDRPESDADLYPGVTIQRFGP